MLTPKHFSCVFCTTTVFLVMLLKTVLTIRNLFLAIYLTSSKSTSLFLCRIVLPTATILSTVKGVGWGGGEEAGVGRQKSDIEC